MWSNKGAGDKFFAFFPLTIILLAFLRYEED